ncbi:hypothetical protein SAMN02982929_00900 [Saccharopolyspora kobensis]|uniref:Uncharacterized protein n=1 Tax=Saccharopolyspora kobensis TaxID=146035 RepID=A0A1H5VJ92_9PSEU|nr:hypothetical protein [Saccharopolyspora kobensis]SEF87435.1 hypothetical protein SAMN02982929_00900 [Saccharopolyspora kobensis]SFC60154.1 hypothetical protein SAMN05216506_1011170 [Saccharopolyspora kobensis]
MITLFIGVTCLYIILFVVTLVAAIAVIAPTYLTSVLGHPTTFGDYLHLVRLATSLGTVAGALGASLETREAVLRATYGGRERERRALALERQNRDSDS